MPPPERHFTAAQAVAEAAAAPQSAKKARLAALLLDAEADRRRAAADLDILAFRARLAAGSDALALVFALAAGRLALATEAVPVRLADYGRLPVEDFMVSLYNGHTVQRLLIALPGGGRRDVHAVLAAALAALAELSP